MKLFSLVALIFLAAQSPQISSDELLGKIDPKSHPDFVRISHSYTAKSDIYLRKQAYEAFERMFMAAQNDGIKLQIISATRTFNYQKGIWDRKWKQAKYEGWSDIDKVKDILTYSAMPGISRHHWGTDIDLNSLDNRYFGRTQGFIEYQWLVEYASEYGYYQSYTSKSDGRTGFEEEKWHWTYLPLSKDYLKRYQELITPKNIQGFNGDQTADSLDVISIYVLGINPNILD